MQKLECPQCKSDKDWKAVQTVEAVSSCEILFDETYMPEIEIEHFQFDAMAAHTVRYVCMACGYVCLAEKLMNLIKPLDEYGFKADGTFRDQLKSETEVEWSSIKAKAEAARLDRRHAAAETQQERDVKPEEKFLRAFG